MIKMRKKRILEYSSKTKINKVDHILKDFISLLPLPDFIGMQNTVCTRGRQKRPNLKFKKYQIPGNGTEIPWDWDPVCQPVLCNIYWYSRIWIIAKGEIQLILKKKPLLSIKSGLSFTFDLKIFLARECTLTQLKSGRRYKVHIRTINSGSEKSEWNSMEFVTLSDRPGAPDSISVTAVQSESVSIEWKEPNSNGSPITG